MHLGTRNARTKRLGMTNPCIHPGQSRSLIILAGLALVALGAGAREDRYSCHLCMALKEVRTRSLFSLPMIRREGLSSRGNAEFRHEHDWYRYSYHYSNGIGGCLGSGVVCHTDGIDRRR
jgi:hypothetical protein